MRALAIVCVLVLAGCAHQSGWQQVASARQPGEVSVFVRHDPDTGSVAYRGVIELEHALTTVLAGLADFKHYPDWLFRCRTLETRPDQWGAGKVRVVIKGLGLVSGREVLLDNNVELELGGGAVLIRSRAATGSLPESSGLVRMPVLDNLFRVKPLATDRTRLTFRTAFDPGGSMPDWLTARVARRVPATSLRAFDRHLDEQDYSPDELDHLPISPDQLRALLLSRGGKQ